MELENKPHKKVHFDLVEEKTPEAGQVPCQIGRRILRLNYDDRYPAEVKAMFACVANIERIQISSDHFEASRYDHNQTMGALRVLFTNILELTKLSCLQDQIANIEHAIFYFVSDLFDELKTAPIPLGQTGFDVYLMQLKMLNQYVKDIRHVFTSLGVDPKQTGLSSLMPPEPYQGAEAHGFPANIVDLFKTLDSNNSENIVYWLTLLRHYEDHLVILSGYASEIVVQLQLNYAEHERYVVRFLSHLRLLIDALRTAEPQLSGIQILENILTEAITPPRSSIRISKPVSSTHTISANDLKKNLKSLEKTKTFEQNFKKMRSDLTICLSRLERNEDKKILLADLRSYIAEKLDPELKQVIVLLRYIAHAEKRIDVPLTNALTERYVQLRAIYGNDARQTHFSPLHFTALQCAKGNFIEKLNRHIQSHPAQTYTECIREVSKTEPPRIKALIERSDAFRFFDTRHRFRDFIDKLKKAEPDYDAPEEPSCVPKKGKTHK